MKKIDSNECHTEFGLFIKEARIEKKLTQNDVAEALGISRPYLSYIERGERNIDLADAIKICDGLGIDIREFISRYM